MEGKSEELKNSSSACHTSVPNNDGYIPPSTDTTIETTKGTFVTFKKDGTVQSGSLILSEAQHRVLFALANTCSASLDDEKSDALVEKFAKTPEHGLAVRSFAQRKGTETDLVPKFVALLADPIKVPPACCSSLLLGLTLLSSSFGMFGLSGYFKPFYELTVSEREDALLRMLRSSLETKRVLASSLIKLSQVIYMSSLPLRNENTVGVDPSRRNVNWDAIGYDGPDPNAHPIFAEGESNTLLNARLKSALQSVYRFTPLQFQAGASFATQPDARLQRFSPVFFGSETDKSNSKRADTSKQPSPTSIVEACRLSFLRAYQSHAKKAGKDEADHLLEADVVIIGSGMGGGVAAQALADPSLRVLILEKGQYYPPESLTLVEEDAMQGMYEGSSFLTTSDATLSILAGSTVGGGTAVNWACSLDPPASLRQEWALEHNLPHITTDKFQAGLDYIKQRMGVHLEDVTHNKPNQILVQGGKSMGYNSYTAPQNGTKNHDCGWCCFGCIYGEKQGTNHTFLVDAVESGAHLVAGAMVERISHTKLPSSLSKTERHATGVVFSVKDSVSGKQIRCRVSAPLVILSAGALHSPLVLKRSRVPDQSQSIGKNLRLHPVVASVGVFPKGSDVRCFSGTIMTGVVEAPPHPDDFLKSSKNPKRQYLYASKIEVPSPHPGLAAACLKWRGLFGSKEDLLSYDRIAPFICLQRDSYSGTVSEGFGGLPHIDYRLSSKDAESLTRALVASMHIFVKAGAVRLITPIFGVDDVDIDPSLGTNDPEFVKVVAKVEELGVHASKAALLSAHQMGTCRMNGDRSLGVVKPTGQLWGVDGLYVCDASVFPTSSGVNPMLTTGAMARSIAINAEEYSVELFGLRKEKTWDQMPDKLPSSI